MGYVIKMFPRLSETFVLNEILELERRGVEVTLFSLKKPDEGRFHPQVSQLRAPVVYLEDAAGKKGLAALAQYWPALRPHRDRAWEALDRAFSQADGQALELLLAAAIVAGAAAERGLHHLHAHFASGPATVAYFASRLSGLGFSFTAHAKDIYLGTVDEGFLRDKLTAARFVVTVCEFNRHHLLSRFKGLDPDVVRVVYNGIDLDLFAFEAESRQKDLILSIGRLVPKKGFDVLLEACAILQGERVPFRCAIVGEGPERARLEAVVRERGLQKSVELLGARPQPEVVAGLKHAAALALACVEDADGNRDALPTVLIEALSTGCPVVSTAITGIPEIVSSGRDGLLVPPGDPTALAQALASVLSAPADAAERARRGRRKAEERFDLRKSAESLEIFFRAAAGRRVPLKLMQPAASA
jgi:glycosyltransferase involved in cell wall biosynthesis